MKKRALCPLSGVHLTIKPKYYIGARDAGGNGGWYVYYAKTLDEVKEKLDIHPSIAI